MTTMRTLMLLIAGLGAAALAGCGANVPEHPTWQDDVRPIMVARCVRCHDAALGETDPWGRHAVGNFSSASFSDISDTDKTLFATAPALMQTDVPLSVMPPPPNAKLADWQIETLTRFVKDNLPSQ